MYYSYSYNLNTNDKDKTTMCCTTIKPCLVDYGLYFKILVHNF